MKKETDLLLASPLFSGITGEELEQLLPALGARRAAYGRGEYLLRAGEPTSVRGVVLEGRALVVQEDFWGSRQLLAALGPGQCFAETFACAPGLPLNVSVAADTALEVLYLQVKPLLEQEGLADHGKLSRNLLTEMARKNVAFSQKLNYLGRRTTREKLLGYLSAQARAAGSREFDIPFNRQQLADYLLVERSGLSKTLCDMRDEGLLDFRKNHFLLRQSPED